MFVIPVCVLGLISSVVTCGLWFVDVVCGCFRLLVSLLLPILV